MVRNRNNNELFEEVNIGMEPVTCLKYETHNRDVPHTENPSFGVSENGRVPQPQPQPTRLTWKDVTFEVNQRKWTFEKGCLRKKLITKQILQKQSGEICSGTLTAIMGPSGAGKSTLLNCFSGRYNEGVGGQIYVSSPDKSPHEKKSNINLVFVPQKDELFRELTVRETLLFASKIKNRGNVDHEDEARKVIKYLSLERCSDSRISICSGGQLKRACIGVELISKPDILVLDEPTTGLDSATAAKCIQLLRRLAESSAKPPAIVATIHQPNYKIFNFFHKIYILSRNGHNIYFGPPSEIVPHLAQFGLSCPEHNNPSDFIIEVAYGDYGQECFSQLDQGHKAIDTSHDEKFKKTKISTIIKKMKNQKMPILRHIWLLLMRTWQITFRGSNSFWLRVLQNIGIAFLVGYLWDYSIGEEDGCRGSSPLSENGTQVDPVASILVKGFNQIKNEYLEKATKLNNNPIAVFNAEVYVVMVSVLQSVLTFPIEASIIRKEMSNNWYRVGPYFLSKTMADFPISVITLFALLMILFPITGQIWVFWRLASVYLVILLMMEICLTIGMLFGTLLYTDPISATLLACGSVHYAISFGGLLVRTQSMPWFFKPFAYLSYIKLAFDANLSLIYGFGRCEAGLKGDFLDELLAVTSPVKLAASAWHKFDLSSFDSRRFALLINVEETCFANVKNLTANYLGIGAYSGAEKVITNEANEHQPSYVLHNMGINESDLLYIILGMLFYMFVLKLSVFLLIRHRTKSDR